VIGADWVSTKVEGLLVDDLKADSLDMVCIHMNLEEEFGIEIPDEDFEAIKSVQDVINYIAGRMKE
jgi:acyl carrier protein